MTWIREEHNQAFEITELIFGGILPIILIIVGTIGNLLCINYLLQGKHRRKRSVYIYLIFLCLADTLSLYQWNLDYIAMQFDHRKKLSDQSLFLCRSIAFLSFYTLHLSAVFLTLIVVDWTLVLWSRCYRYNMTKRRQALLISLIVSILLFILDGFLLSLGMIDKNTNEVRCYQSLNSNLMYFYKIIYPWIHLITMYIIPFLIMIIGIIAIIIKLYTRRTNTRYFNQKQRLSLVLVTMCIVYMLLTLPNRLCFSVFFSNIANHSYSDTILLASNTLLYTRNATNIVFLGVSSIKFRKRLVKLFCFCCHRQWRNRVFPIQQTEMKAGIDQFQASN